MVIVNNKGGEIGELEAIKVRVSADQGMETLLLSGMDSITTREEVLVAVCEVAGLHRGLVVVGELRGSYGGSQIASVRLPRTGAVALHKKERLRIGLNWCLIRERVDVLRCFRCWQYGHIGRDCEEETDQSKSCWKCGDEGHKAADCDRQIKCLTCKAVGHMAGGAKPEKKRGY